MDVNSIEAFLKSYMSIKQLFSMNKLNNSNDCFVIPLFKFIKSYYLTNDNNLESI